MLAYGSTVDFSRCNPNILGADQVLKLSKREKMATVPSNLGLIPSNDRSLSKKTLSLRKIIATRIQLISFLDIAPPLLARLIAYQPIQHAALLNPFRAELASFGSVFFSTLTTRESTSSGRCDRDG